MSGYLLWIFLLALWNVILFFGKGYGVSVVLFIVPLLGYLYYLLKKNNKIVNKSGLLFMIPIFLLSLTYLFFYSETFYVLNVFMIPLLICLMIIFTINPVYRLKIVLQKIIEILFFPYKYIARLYRVTVHRIGEKLKVSTKLKKVLLTLVIVIPITLIVVGLLSSADMIFGKIFNSFFDKLLDILRLEFFDHLLGRLTGLIIMFFVIGCTTMFIMYEFSIKDEEKKENKKERDLLTVKTLVTVLNVIYVVFDFIQIKSLIFHSVASDINFAEYARQGFFQLMVVSLINILIILITRKFETKKNESQYRYVKVMNVIMIFLTIVIIASSFLRMHMYESAFGYTTLRLLVYATLITESILMIPTVMYIFNENVNIAKSYMIIIICAYVAVNFMNMDYVIAKKNINRYYAVNDIDIEYLENYGSANIPLLIKLYNKTEDEIVKKELGLYLYEMKFSCDEEKSIFEYNMSDYKAEKELKKLKADKYIKGYLDYE